MKLSFHGADRSVTGSCHLVECAGRRVLIDCGLYQRGDALAEENTGSFGFEPTTIEYVLLTHAHLDHCGRLPLLAKRGFQGEIISTAATRELTRLVLLDAAHVQEEEARYFAHRAAEHGIKQKALQPLYSVPEALSTFDFFGRTATYGQSLIISPGINATFIDAGHILGSASIVMQLKEGEFHREIVFSGDLGNVGNPLLQSPATPPKTDIVVLETTYGNRLHKSLDSSVDELYRAINETFRRGGNVIIPTFALDRAQLLLYFLREGLEQERLPHSMQTFLDSPMAISATEIFKHHPECLKPAIAELFRRGDDPFNLPGLHFVRETSESIGLNNVRGGTVIMAGSGMCTSGRIMHHLSHNLWREDSSIVFVGYAAEGTLARRIIDGSPQVSVLGEDVSVRAAIHTIDGFSAHADQAELLAWHEQTCASRTFLVHGDETVMRSFANKLSHTHIELPMLNETFDL